MVSFNTSYTTFYYPAIVIGL